MEHNVAVAVDDKMKSVLPKIRDALRELDPDLSDEDVEVALSRVLFYAAQEHARRGDCH